ncbi:glycyl-tRNA synthetase 1 [Xylariaceae sp. FL0255]|nr:glycyl-tRNA synthetase 1 [Xylariaceae sp. FL0255]
MTHFLLLNNSRRTNSLRLCLPSAMAPSTTLKGDKFDRPLFESVMKRRFFYTESFEIYRTSSNFTGDNRGLYDYGPPGCALQSNIVDTWRKHFVLEENMLELDCTVVTPWEVLKQSGHVDKFEDCMCKDLATGEYLRADHLIENVLETRLATGLKGNTKKSPKLDEATIAEYKDILAKIDNYDINGLRDIINGTPFKDENNQTIRRGGHDIRNPNGNGNVEDPETFNLMFKSNIGPSRAITVYLRPETAQGQFLNFKKLLDYNQGAMPFASASIGKSYRNEISPRSGLLRVREFMMSEIEHYVDPEKKSHPRFSEAADLKLPLLDKDIQLSGKTTTRELTIAEAVKSKVIDNETLGYFMGRIYLFLVKIGIDPTKLRFRQHMANEMAHYACDCWDAEIFTSYGWIECVGCADRSAFDLTKHSNYTGAPLMVKEPLAEPVKFEELEASLEKKLMGRRFLKDSKLVQTSLEAQDQKQLEALAAELAENGVVNLTTPTLSDGKSTSVELGKDILTIKKVIRVVRTREYIPNVIEPSFGIGRILYCLLEHLYWHRPNDVARAVFSFPFAMAPTKVLIVPLSNQPQFTPIVKKVLAHLRSLGISNNVDSSTASIGKRYARNDELGTPLGITIDFDTVSNGSITLRERDSMAQVRASEEDIVQAVKSLVDGHETWEQVAQRLPAFLGQGVEDE